MSRSVLFLDRDGTLIEEPPDEQVDSLEKLSLVPGVIPALLRVQRAGYRFVVVTNQDGLGTPAYPQEAYDRVHERFVALFASQGIEFDDVLVCPHRPADGCTCRKPHLGLLRPLLAGGGLDLARCAVVGDRASDLELAANLGARGLRLVRNGRRAPGAGWDPEALTWPEVARELLALPRRGVAERRTKETAIRATVQLDGEGTARVATGIGFLDHMLEQLARHGGFDLELTAEGDLHVDEHHTVEDVAIVLGTALERALGDRVGIGRYGAALPMDEAAVQVLVDLSGRSFFRFSGDFGRERVGELPTELVPHFLRSFAEALGATLHVEVEGENAHHMVEAVFKGLARALRPALALERGAYGVPSTKGVL